MGFRALEGTLSWAEDMVGWDSDHGTWEDKVTDDTDSQQADRTLVLCAT